MTPLGNNRKSAVRNQPGGAPRWAALLRSVTAGDVNKVPQVATTITFKATTRFINHGVHCDNLMQIGFSQFCCYATAFYRTTLFIFILFFSKQWHQRCSKYVSSCPTKAPGCASSTTCGGRRTFRQTRRRPGEEFTHCNPGSLFFLGTLCTCLRSDAGPVPRKMLTLATMFNVLFTVICCGRKTSWSNKRVTARCCSGRSFPRILTDHLLPGGRKMDVSPSLKGAQWLLITASEYERRCSVRARSSGGRPRRYAHFLRGDSSERESEWCLSLRVTERGNERAGGRVGPRLVSLNRLMGNLKGARKLFKGPWNFAVVSQLQFAIIPAEIDFADPRYVIVFSFNVGFFLLLHLHWGWCGWRETLPCDPS